jgi:hypothetical protein
LALSIKKFAYLNEIRIPKFVNKDTPSKSLLLKGVSARLSDFATAKSTKVESSIRDRYFHSQKA